MTYLRIASPGVANHLALTVIGVGMSRYSDNADTIGQFSSGSKNASALLLRNNLPPVIVAGLLKMHYGTNGFQVDDRLFDRVVVRQGSTLRRDRHCFA
jgi:hypothetical protein